MSVDSPDSTVSVDLEAEDHEQTLLSVECDGVQAVIAVEHGARLNAVHDALRDAAKEIQHQTHLSGRDATWDDEVND